MPVAHFYVGGCAIVLVVCNTVSNSETFEVGLESIGIVGVGDVVLVDVVREVGNVNSSV